MRRLIPNSFRLRIKHDQVVNGIRQSLRDSVVREDALGARVLERKGQPLERVRRIKRNIGRSSL